MTLMLGLFFAVTVLLELGLPFLPKGWGAARTLAGAVTAGLLTALSIHLLLTEFTLFTSLIAFLSIYRIVNIARAAKARMHVSYLRRVCTITALWLIGAQMAIHGLYLAWGRLPIDAEPTVTFGIWQALAVLQAVTALILFLGISGHLKRSSTPVSKKAFSSQELPSITVAIAARNETESLLACIRSLLASDYPKLEIIVLDDCSQTRRTPEIIRGYANDGVRFIPGNEPDPTWLARNHAYHKLSEAANGEYILFLSASARVEPDSIRLMVGYLLIHKKQMLSIMPRTTALRGIARLVETMQAAWELLPPRRYLGRPPIATASWMINRTALSKAGGFGSVSRMVAPEIHFAKAISRKDGYSFVPGGHSYGVSSEADVEEQYARAVRSSYPAIGKRPELAAFVTIGIVLLVVLPFAMVWFILANKLWWPVSVLSLMSSICLLWAYSGVLRLTFGTAPAPLVLAFPVAAILNIIMRHYSMYKYEFSEVVWKERNICVPVMHVVPKLPTTAGSGSRS